jgi:DNA-binding response OmpR family regulator
MKLLIAEDDGVFQATLTRVLAPYYQIVLAEDGQKAWDILQQPDAPSLAILDWVMPGLTGPEICRKVRASQTLSSMYLIILTSKNSEADIVAGLRAGADDYITKPPTTAELRARTSTGERILALQEAVSSQSGLSIPVAASRKALVREITPDYQPRRRANRYENSEPLTFIPPRDCSDYALNSSVETTLALKGISGSPVENGHGKR